MRRLLDLTNDEARAFFMKGSSYFSLDLPPYLDFEPLLRRVATALSGRSLRQDELREAAHSRDVNYVLVSNKDGRFAWRPFEMIHPAIYVSLVNLLCEDQHWQDIVTRFREFARGSVECCSLPVVSEDDQSDAASQVRTWWDKVEQRSLVSSLEFTHLLHTDVTDCYGSLYTHSVAWALHGQDTAKENRQNRKLLGNCIDAHLQAGRYGQTNGIAQGSVLMDIIAELVLGYVDVRISKRLVPCDDIRIVRYRDDYRIFANNDERVDQVLKIVSDELRAVGMKLSSTKTVAVRNVVEGSVKPDKLTAIDLQDLGDDNAKTIQKKLLRLHAFGQRHPNSGALRRLLSDFHASIVKQTETPNDLDVQVAIATDIAVVSPVTFPAVAGIVSHLISLAPADRKVHLWKEVREKMRRIPNNGYLEIWLQRVVQPRSVGLKLESEEPICKIVNGEAQELWANDWITDGKLRGALDVSQIVVADVADASEVVRPTEVALFRRAAWYY